MSETKQSGKNLSKKALTGIVRASLAAATFSVANRDPVQDSARVNAETAQSPNELPMHTPTAPPETIVPPEQSVPPTTIAPPETPTTTLPEVNKNDAVEPTLPPSYTPGDPDEGFYQDKKAPQEYTTTPNGTIPTPSDEPPVPSGTIPAPNDEEPSPVPKAGGDEILNPKIDGELLPNAAPNVSDNLRA